MRVRAWAEVEKDVGVKRRKGRQNNAALDPILPAPGDNLNIEPSLLIVAPMTEETITLYAAPPPPLVMDTGGSTETAEKKIEEAKVRKPIQKIVTEEEETVTEEGEGMKLIRQPQMHRRHLYNEDEEEEKQKKKKLEEEEERKRNLAKMRRMKISPDIKRGNSSSSHQFPSSVRGDFLHDDLAKI